MMPDDLRFLDQLEEWLEAQVPKDLQGLPYRMFETMERMSNEIFDTLNINAPSSISIPFPPFNGKEAPPPPPPPSTFAHLPVTLYNRADKLVRAHPYVVGTGAALAMGLGMTYGVAHMGYGGRWGKAVRDRRKFGTRGVVEDGLLKEAIVILSPSPMPPLLLVLTATLLKAGYIVLVGVPRVAEADALEKKLGPLMERSGLRVLIYNPEDSTTFPPFHTSLMATLRLPFIAPNASPATDRPASPNPHVAHIHAFVSLYAMNPCPPSQPAALPALPSLLKPDHTGRAPMLITVYPSGSVLVQPDSFASQVLTKNHRLLGENLAVSTPARIVSLYVGHLDLPPLHTMMVNAKTMMYRFTFIDKWKQATAYEKLFVVKDELINRLSTLYSAVTGRLGYGTAAKDYKHFERRFLRVLKRGRRSSYTIGQYSTLPFILSHISPGLLGPLLRVLPALPGPNGPLSLDPRTGRYRGSYPTPPSSVASSMTDGSIPSAAPAGGPGSAGSSDNGSAEYLGDSMHASSKTTGSSNTSSGSGTGLDESWAHLDSESARD